MENLTAIIIVGVYTLIYLIVSLIQKSQISKLKDTNTAMKSFIDIFKIDEVKKYVEMREENIIDKASKMVANDDAVIDVAREVFINNFEEIKEKYDNVMKKRNLEMSYAVIKLLNDKPKDEQVIFINENLKLNSDIFMKHIDKFDNLLNEKENKNAKNKE